MSEFLYGQDELVGKFVAMLVPGYRGGFGNCKTIGILDDDGRLIAGLVYHHWDPDAGVIGISGAATDPRWLSRATIRRMFDYAFDECGCQMVVMRIRADNRRLLRQIAIADFSFTLIPRLYGRDADGVVATLTDDAWHASKLCRHLRRQEEPEIDHTATLVPRHAQEMLEPV